MNEVKLKPCPFCGGEAGITTDIYSKYVASCKECGAVSKNADTIDGAAKAWNKRDGRQTYREYFEEQFPWDAFPDADVDEIISKLRVCQLWGKEHVATDCEAISCATHWDREMP